MIVTAGAMAERGDDGRWIEYGAGDARVTLRTTEHAVTILAEPFSCLLLMPLGGERPAPRTEGRLIAPGLLEAAEVDRADALLEQDLPESKLLLQGWASEFLARAIHAAGGRQLREAPGWLKAVRQRLERASGPPLDARALAREVGVHPAHLSRAFTQHYGRSMRRFVRERRVARALTALRDSDRTISSIAADAGFADHAHLVRSMRAHLGTTPTSLRQGDAKQVQDRRAS